MRFDPTNIIPFPSVRKMPALVTALQKTAGAENSTLGFLAPEWTVRFAIKHARRKGVSMSSLPPIVRQSLAAHCERGDPTCRLVRDWLNGNLHVLPPEIQSPLNANRGEAE